MVPFYDSTAPYDSNNYAIVWRDSVYDDTSTTPVRLNPSKLTFDLVKINDYSLTTNRPGKYQDITNRYERRKERALKREKPRLSRRRHKHAK